MWHLETPWYELIVRATIIYFATFLLLRLWGKKHLAQMSPFDFILLLIMSEALQNALIGKDISVFGGLVTVSTFMAWDSLINKLCYKFKKLETLLNGSARILIQDGVLNELILKDEMISLTELHEALRLGGTLHVSDVKRATLESNGHISVIPYKN